MRHFAKPLLIALAVCMLLAGRAGRFNSVEVLDPALQVGVLD
jgi:hypothetical protein